MFKCLNTLQRCSHDAFVLLRPHTSAALHFSTSSSLTMAAQSFQYSDVGGDNGDRTDCSLAVSRSHGRLTGALIAL